MKAVSTRIEREVIMLMRDGTRLRADIYQPDDRRRHPAIFIRTPGVITVSWIFWKPSGVDMPS
jgi:predicted acyl esterase